MLAIRRNRGRRRTVSTVQASPSIRARSTRIGNRTYLGEAVHKGTSYPGEREAIIDRATWDKVQAILAENTVARSNSTRSQTPALLRGLIFAPGDRAMTPSHSRKNGRLYRYYVSTDAIRQGYTECPLRSVPAAEVEEAVVAQVRHLLRTPEIIAREPGRRRSMGVSCPSARWSGPSRTSRRYGTSSSRSNRGASSGCWWSGHCRLTACRFGCASKGSHLLEELRSPEVKAA